jgi:DNA-binding transcriptional LysR family regulator
VGIVRADFDEALTCIEKKGWEASHSHCACLHEIRPGLGDRRRRNIRQRPLYVENYATVVRGGHPCARTLDRAGIVAQRHVLVTMGDVNHQYAAAGRILDALLPASAVLCHVPSFTAAAHIVLHTDAMATLPLRLVHSLADDLGLEAVETPVSLPPLQLAMYWHERSHRDPANRWLRSIVRGLLGDDPGAAAEPGERPGR